MRLHTGEPQRAEGENGLIAGYVGRHACGGAQTLGTGMGLASTWLAEQRAPRPGRLTMAWVLIMGGLTVFSVYFYHTEEWTERNQQILEAASREIR